jgi:hypothetical protein
MFSGIADPLNVSFLPTNEVVSNICRKLTACNSNLGWDVCADGLKTRPDIDTEVGFPNGTFATFADAIKADLNHQVRTFDYEFNECLQGLSKLKCDDPKVMSAYDPNAIDAFGSVTAMFSPICADMFYYEP